MGSMIEMGKKNDIQSGVLFIVTDFAKLNSVGSTQSQFVTTNIVNFQI